MKLLERRIGVKWVPKVDYVKIARLIRVCMYERWSWIIRVSKLTVILGRSKLD
jgi:hypothetical protein